MGFNFTPRPFGMAGRLSDKNQRNRMSNSLRPFSFEEGHKMMTDPGGLASAGLYRRGKMPKFDNTPLPEDTPIAPMEFTARTSLPEFEAARRRMTEQFSSEKQGGNDAIQRRFASMGALNSGAAIKQQQVFQDKLREQQANALGDLGAQEAGQLANMNDERKFQIDVMNRDNAFKQKVFSFERASKLKELDLAKKQFQMDWESTEFNKRLADLEAGRKPPGMLAGIFPQFKGF